MMNSNNKKLEKRVLNNNPKFKGRKYLSHSKTYEEYKKLIEEGLTQIEIAREIGKSPSAIHQYINRHPELPRPIKHSKLRKIYDSNKSKK